MYKPTDGIRRPREQHRRLGAARTRNGDGHICRQTRTHEKNIGAHKPKLVILSVCRYLFVYYIAIIFFLQDKIKKDRL